MSWKCYSLGTYEKAIDVTNRATYKLKQLGYVEPTYTKNLEYYGSYQVTINGEIYVSSFWKPNSGSYDFYLWVNDETNDLLITSNNASATPGCDLRNMLNWAIMSGTKSSTGEDGLFVFKGLNYAASSFTNASVVGTDSYSYIVLYKAAFFYHAQCVDVPFVSNIFWGTKKLSVGATITVGTDRFVCLGGYLYAKL